MDDQLKHDTFCLLAALCNLSNRAVGGLVDRRTLNEHGSASSILSLVNVMCP